LIPPPVNMLTALTAHGGGPNLEIGVRIPGSILRQCHTCGAAEEAAPRSGFHVAYHG
jgi:hypothetical protein